MQRQQQILFLLAQFAAARFFASGKQPALAPSTTAAC